MDKKEKKTNKKNKNRKYPNEWQKIFFEIRDFSFQHDIYFHRPVNEIEN